MASTESNGWKRTWLLAAGAALGDVLALAGSNCTTHFTLEGPRDQIISLAKDQEG